jgi:8-oxo-dGTP pyrophosphatase MutT (NUDIX family)
MKTDLSPIRELLAGHRPGTRQESADVARIQALISTGDPWSRSLPLHVTVSALVVHPRTRRVLLRWHVRQQAWLQVGGHADPGEVVPVDIALREGREETGLGDLACWPDASLCQVVVVPVPASVKEPAHEHADLRFVLATGTPDQARPENPAAALRWLTVPEAYEITTEANLREFLSRVAELFDRVPPS